MLKLMNIEAFGISFKKYDLISSRFNHWIYIYPFFELLIGISFLLSEPPSSVILIALNYRDYWNGISIQGSLLK